jgi:hypothetical protein
MAAMARAVTSPYALVQRRIDQRGVARVALIGAHHAHGEIDGGVIGHIEKQDLRDPEQECALDARRLRRQAAFELGREHMAQGAEAPQHGRHQLAHERAVAFGERAQRRVAFELRFERVLLLQDAFENFRGDAADGKAGSGRRHGELRKLAGSKRSVRPVLANPVRVVRG